jgi:hypothetical protein
MSFAPEVGTDVTSVFSYRSLIPGASVHGASKVLGGSFARAWTAELKDRTISWPTNPLSEEFL